MGSLRDFSKNILKQGMGKGESYSKGGGGFESVTTLALVENFNHTYGGISKIRINKMLYRTLTGSGP